MILTIILILIIVLPILRFIIVISLTKQVELLITKSASNKLEACHTVEEVNKVKDEFVNLDLKPFFSKAAEAVIFPFRSLDTSKWMTKELMDYIND